MTTVTYSVPAIHCHHCTHTIEMELGELAGVQSVKANMNTRKIEVTFEEPATEDSIKSLLAEINYPVGSGLLTV